MPSIQADEDKQSESENRPNTVRAYIVTGLLGLSFIVHLASSQAVTDLISEVHRLLFKFVF